MQVSHVLYICMLTSGGATSMTLDQVIDAFHRNPSFNTAREFNTILHQYRTDGIISIDTFNKYFEEVATYFLVVDPINRLWDEP